MRGGAGEPRWHAPNPERVGNLGSGPLKDFPRFRTGAKGDLAKDLRTRYSVRRGSCLCLSFWASWGALVITAGIAWRSNSECSLRDVW
eukprot:3904972-Pyramimonas_sp.AAC.1